MAEQNEHRLTELLAGVAQGRRDDFEAFYRATAGKVLTLAYRMLGEQHAAEDCAAEVFLQVWKNAARYAPERGTPSVWLMMMCRTRAIDRLRQAKGHGRPALPCDGDEDVFGLSGLTPDAILETFQTGTKLYDAMAMLSTVQQQLIGLAFYKGLSHAQISDHTGLPLGTVKSHIRRGLQGIREALESDASLLEDMAYAAYTKA